MKTSFLFLLFFGFTAGVQAQAPTPDSSVSDSLQAKSKADTVIVKGKDSPAIPEIADTLAPGKKSDFRSPSGALLRSLAIPGWGQLYNRKYFKAVIIAGGQGALLGTAVVEWKRASDAKDDLDFEGYRVHTNNRNLFLWLYAAASVVSILDAYVDAHLSQDTGEGVPQIGNLIVEPDAGEKALLVKIKVDF